MGGNLWRMFVTDFLLTSMAIVLVVGRIGVARPETVVTLDPRINVAAPDESFDVNVTVTNVAELFCYEGNLAFDPSVLNCTSVEEGPFLGTAGGTWWMDPVIDNYNGWAFFGDSLWGPPFATGNGTLAIVTFDVLAEGTSPLSFSETALYIQDEEGVAQPIEHTAEGGIFMYPLRRDVAVTRVSASPLSVTAGENMSIEVTVKNKGDATESFDVTVKYDSTAIETKTVTNLAPGRSETLSFSWDTTGVVAGSYTIKAEASPVPGEDNTANNVNYTDQEITIELFHDVAIINVVPSSTSASAGETVSIDVTVKNEGSTTETFNVTVLYDSTDIETKTVTNLAPGGSETLSFSWDTTGVAESDYTITAVATTLPSETETEDNTHSEVVVTVTAPPPSTTIPIGFLGGIIIAAVAVCVAMFLYVRRRRSTRV